MPCLQSDVCPFQIVSSNLKKDLRLFQETVHVTMPGKPKGKTKRGRKGKGASKKNENVVKVRICTTGASATSKFG